MGYDISLYDVFCVSWGYLYARDSENILYSIYIYNGKY